MTICDAKIINYFYVILRQWAWFDLLLTLVVYQSSVMTPSQMDENGKMKGGFELRAIGKLLV